MFINKGDTFCEKKDYKTKRRLNNFWQILQKDDRDLQWFVSLIVNSILKILVQCLGCTSRKLVMEKALSNVNFLKIYKITYYLLKMPLPSKRW